MPQQGLTMRREVLRLIDANLNRSREGLRVCEDIARFILASPALTKALKSVRHRIFDIIKRIPAKGIGLPGSRDTETDIGRVSKTRSETTRLNSADIFMANIERVKESLRVLEEFLKLNDAEGSLKFKALRFRVYDIEKMAFKKISSLRSIR